MRSKSVQPQNKTLKFTRMKIPDVVLVEPAVFGDHRGFFSEAYHAEKYIKGGITATFVQDNRSSSVKNTLRGLHMQIKHPQGKLVSVIDEKGVVFDVAVDLRVGSPTFKQWVGVTLSGANFKQLYIPPGFAHGFCVLSDTARFEYKCTDYYCPEGELGVRWDDPEIGINWPITHPILSKKDLSLSLISEIRDKLPKTKKINQD